MGANESAGWDESAGAGGGAGLDALTGGGGGGGVGGVIDGELTIPVAEGARDPYTRFAHLCGEGCTPGGDPGECASSGGPEPGIPLPPAASTLHCQLVLADGDAAPRCGPVGRFAAGGPCQTAADCGAGLGCVAAEGQGGVCRQYCCGSVESCERATYCAERPMAESVGEESARVSIPVCVPAVNCELLNDSVCPAGLTCTIVREDGTTSCVVPGAGRADEPCPCAPGFVCSMLTNKCKRLCRIDGEAQGCGTGAKCQGGSTVYPPGFGVCVGGSY
ncbi:hypothetical protein SOCEGT47_067410 [Sorangium cellulosum]|uniref:Uncharacterized protein n=1 Tax=Sorangium cellulosum TaxID=56 RepID=A0A4P2Q9C9_SORCE|nr:hypothetical protein [Sorangium cellulosum]AUX26180.1 hypothetical protein SOCEGT47_067410 [Sorangium cellulosum]